MSVWKDNPARSIPSEQWVDGASVAGPVYSPSYPWGVFGTFGVSGYLEGDTFRTVLDVDERTLRRDSCTKGPGRFPPSRRSRFRTRVTTSRRERTEERPLTPSPPAVWALPPSGTGDGSDIVCSVSRPPSDTGPDR